jgi:hypothetical protein
MKRMSVFMLSLWALVAIAAGAQQVPKVVGTISEKNIVTRFGPDANDFYGFQSYWRAANIDASQSSFENLVLRMRVYIDNLDRPGNLSFINDAGFAMIEFGNEMTPTDSYVQWGIKNLPTPLQHGWTELYLPLTSGDRKSAFDLTKPLNWFRFCFARIPGEPDALQIRLRDIEVIDTSVLVDPPSDEEEVWETDFLVADIDYAMNMPLALNTTFAVGRPIVPAIDASAHNPQQLYLAFDANITERSPGDIFVLSRVSGQIELTSTTGPDQKEMLWGIGSVDWKAGAHSYALPFATAGNSGGRLELDHISFIRFYAVNVPGDYAGRIQMEVSNVRIVDYTNQTKLPALFGDGMMFQQNRPIKVWGTAVAGKTVTVAFFRGDTRLDAQEVVVPESGQWEVAFAGLAASYDRYRLEVLEGETLIQSVDDVLIGEVWLSSGQSNMALNVAGTIDGQALMAAADNDNIRFFLEPTANVAPWVPNTDIQGAYWGSAADGMQLGKVSAVAYAMAARLQDTLGIPVGIVNSAVGSSVIEAWLPAADIDTDPELVLAMKRLGLYLDQEFYPDGTNQMSSYYNLKIHPLRGYAVRGMIWYQGESNSGRPQLYARQLDLLRRSYGRFFGFTADDMPLIFCHVCPWIQTLENPQYLGPLAEAMTDGWAMAPAHTAMLPLYDTDISYVGNVVIHPTNKTPVGQRFATAALALVYNGGGEYTAPVFHSLTSRGDTLVAKFTHVGDGLQTVTGIDEVRGFAVCDATGVYVGAKARIISADEVAVWNERVKAPQQLTYAWATYNVTSNLSNSVAIPAAPFRSDRTADGVRYFNPQDWTYAEGPIWGVDASDGVSFLPAWTGSDNTVLTFVDNRKSEGRSSLEVAYTAGDAGSAYVAPVFSHKTVVPQLANFNTLTFDVLNTDPRPKNISLVLQRGSTLYRAAFVGYEDSDAPELSVTLAPNQMFQPLTFLLKSLWTEAGEEVANAAAVLSNVEELRIVVSDTEDGALYIDNVWFGLSTEKQAGTAIRRPSPDNLFRVVATPDALTVFSERGEALHRMEVFDLQGKTLYTRSGLGATAHTVGLGGSERCYIVKIATASGVSAQKVVVR